MAARRSTSPDANAARRPEPLSPAELAFAQALARVIVERQSAPALDSRG
jgi:hypothetical protein